MKRKKRNKIILSICVVLLAVYLIAKIIEIIGYLNGFKEDVLHKNALAKAFFVKYNFSGNVLNRSYLESDNNLSYFIFIQLDSSVELPSFPNDSYYSKYDFNPQNRTVKIKVNRNVYKNAKILKPVNSDSICIDIKVICYY